MSQFRLLLFRFSIPSFWETAKHSPCSVTCVFEVPMTDITVNFSSVHIYFNEEKKVFKHLKMENYF